MAWRFRRSLKLGPIRLNLSKSGVDYSAGVRGFRVGKDAKGRSYTAASIPGTGIYNRQYWSDSNLTTRSTELPTSPILKTGAGNGFKLVLAFICGGIVFSLITAMLISRPSSQPAPVPPRLPINAPGTSSTVAPVRQHRASVLKRPRSLEPSSSAIPKGLDTPHTSSAQTSDGDPATN